MEYSAADFDFTGWSVDERTILAHRLWQSVQCELEVTPPSAGQLAEIERRVAEADAGRMKSIPWSDVKREIVSRKW